MMTTTKKGPIAYVSKWDSIMVENNGHIVRIDKEKVTVHVDGVQYAQYWMIEHESEAVTAGNPLYCRCAFTAARIKLTMLTPGISTGY